MKKILNVAVIGCGLIGQRRAEQVSNHPDTKLSYVVDKDLALAKRVAAKWDCESTKDFKSIIDAVDIVIVSTPNAFLSDIGIFCLEKNKHVLIEKPMGRNFDEAKKLLSASQKSEGLLKVGFNHRYHPGIMRMKNVLDSKSLGRLINARIIYGHGGRPGYEKEWRGDLALSGGGELTDQGVHVIDLLCWMIGVPLEVYAKLQTVVWPIAPLEDNAMAIMTFKNNCIASIHTSWTQWKNQFTFEIFGELGSAIVKGLGGSYGSETFILHQRNLNGGAPEITEEVFFSEDLSWKLEWEDFVSGIKNNGAYHSQPQESIRVMSVLEALYRSHNENRSIHID